MHEFYPLLVVGAIVSLFATVYILAYVFMKDKKEAIGFDRNMKDSEIIRRLMKYAKPYTKNFIIVLILMIFSIAHEIISPLILGELTNTVGSEDGFELSYLFTTIAIYVAILLVSLVSSYIQALILQRTGQRIVSTSAKTSLLTLKASHTTS